jgi:hypothetical protein
MHAQTLGGADERCMNTVLGKPRFVTRSNSGTWVQCPSRAGVLFILSLVCLLLVDAARLILLHYLGAISLAVGWSPSESGCSPAEERGAPPTSQPIPS